MRLNPSMEGVIGIVTDPSFGDQNANQVLKLFTDLGPDFRAEDVGFTTMADLRKKLNKSMPTLTGTKNIPVYIPGLDGQPVLLLYKNGKQVEFAHHNLWDEALDMARDPLYQDHFVFRPEPEFNQAGERVWSTFKGGLLFEQMQATISNGFLIIAPILASDEATFLSRMSAYPLYCEFRLLPTPVHIYCVRVWPHICPWFSHGPWPQAPS